MPGLIAEGVGAVWQMARRQDGQRVEEVAQVRYGWQAVVDSLRQGCSRLWRLGNSGHVPCRSHGTHHRHTLRVPLPQSVSFARRLWSTHDLSPWAWDALAHPPCIGISNAI